MQTHVGLVLAALVFEPCSVDLDGLDLLVSSVPSGSYTLSASSSPWDS